MTIVHKPMSLVKRVTRRGRSGIKNDEKKISIHNLIVVDYLNRYLQKDTSFEKLYAPYGLQDCLKLPSVIRTYIHKYLGSELLQEQKLIL